MTEAEWLTIGKGQQRGGRDAARWVAASTRVTTWVIDFLLSLRRLSEGKTSGIGWPTDRREGYRYQEAGNVATPLPQTETREAKTRKLVASCH